MLAILVSSLISVTSDKNLSFAQHISAVSKSCFHNIRDVRRNSNANDQTIVIATFLIHFKIDSCNSLLLNLPATQLNTNKTEVMWFGLATNLSKLSAAEKLIKIGPDTILPYAVVRDLGVYFDSELNIKSHISQITRVCFFHLRRLRAVRRELGQVTTARLVSAFVFS